jgi:sugar O-acyltransferase (sialic acid O-acetyltransferase NeuD family)
MHEEKQGLLIFPYNGNALEALGCIGDSYRFIGFVDDTPEKRGITPNGNIVLGREALTKYSDALVLAVPGSPSSYMSRKEVINSLGIENNRYAKIIHPAARISPLASIGFNVLIMAGVVVTSNAVIGSHVCILPNTVIHHDVFLGDWSLIGSNVTIAGNTIVEENCYIGSGSSVMNNLKVEAGALLGLGSNVIKDVGKGRRVAGNPAQDLAKKSSL